MAPFRGAAYVFRARLWHFLLVPLLLNVALAGGSAYLAGRFWRAEMGDRIGGSTVWGTLGLVATTMLGTVILFIILQPLLGAIFNDLLAERVERRITGEELKQPFFASLGRALVHGLLKLILYALALVVGLALGAVTAGLGSVAGGVLGAIFFAYDGFDFPLSRRGASFGAKWRYLALHPAQTIGYGLGTSVFYFLIPLALIVAPPFTAVGATLVFLETEDRKRGKENEKNEGRVKKGED